MGQDKARTGSCLFCGAEDARRLGYCKFCGVGVCEKCGNTHYSMGQCFVAHDSCLKQNDGGFSMIKFVR